MFDCPEVSSNIEIKPLNLVRICVYIIFIFTRFFSDFCALIAVYTFKMNKILHFCRLFMCQQFLVE